MLYSYVDKTFRRQQRPWRRRNKTNFMPRTPFHASLMTRCHFNILFLLKEYEIYFFWQNLILFFEANV